MTAISTLSLTKAPQVSGLDHQTQALADELFAAWRDKFPRNLLRQQYVDMKQGLKNLRIAVPEALEDLEIVMGWPEKAVSMHSDRYIFNGITSPLGGDDPLELRSVLRDNRFGDELQQAIQSAHTHALAFASTTRGSVADGEPEVLIQFHSALWSAGLWDKRRRAIKGALFIEATDSLGRPSSLMLCTPFEWIRCQQLGGSWYLTWREGHVLGRVPIEPLPVKPDLDRPFGRSLISREVMSLTDRAVRTSLRLDVHSELFHAPHLLLLGADKETFTDSAGNPIPILKWYMSQLNTVSRDEDGNIPNLEIISQQSPQPHLDTLRMLSSQFASSVSIPVDALGITRENPESAAAKEMAEKELIVAVSRNERTMGASLGRILENVITIRDGLSEVPEEAKTLNIRWRNPAMPSVVTQSDAMVKQIAAIPKIGETTVALEELGWSEEQILRAEAEWRSSSLRESVTALAGQFSASPSGDAASGAEDAELKRMQILRTQMDAIGIARRAGVNADVAAATVGLPGLKFDPGTPITLKQDGE